MAISSSRLTAQGQISVPAEIRKRLGVGPGAVLEWDEEDGQILIRRAGRYSSQEIHDALFGGETPPPKTLAELEAGRARYVRSRHARD